MNLQSKRPNFFIVGAPKCGTTALRTYLQEHPQVFMCDPKEPAFWATDYPRLREKHSVPLKNKDQYLKLFESSTNNHLIVGEASTAYLSSMAAIPQLMEFNSDSKVLVAIRNPIEFVKSFHNEKYFDLNEDVEDFDRAWRLQAERADGENIPSTCFEPAFLQYGTMGKFGQQLQRLVKLVPANQLHVVLFDDLKHDCAGVYRDILRFLGVDDDGRVHFPIVNSAKAQRQRWITSLYLHSNGWFGHSIKALRRLGRQSRFLRQTKNHLLIGRRTSSEKRVSNELRAELADYFRDDIELLQELLQRDLSMWSRLESTSETATVEK